MTGPGHPQDDRLLELAYGEVEGTEERALRKHVEECPRCRSVLDGIAEVRSAVRRIPPEPAPERGLESLLAYGELAAARARAQRRNVRWLGLITFATAALLVFVLLPQRSAPGAASSEVARMQVPPARMASKVESAPPLRFPAGPPPPPGDQFASASGAPAEEKLAAKPKAKDAERKTEAKRDRDLDPLVLAKKQVAEQRVLREVPATADEGRRAEARADAPAASGPSDAVMQPGPSQGAKRELGQAQAASSGLARAKEPAAPAKVAAAPPAPAATPPSAASAGGRLDTGVASSRTAGKEVEGSGAAGLLGGSAGADKNLGTLGGAGNGAKGAAVVARSANASAENAAGKAGDDRAAQLNRLVEVRRSAASATGDQRKALLLEQCRLEAKLELRASVVGTCSQLAREFPGTPEAQQAIDLARGFSVQPPPPPAP